MRKSNLLVGSTLFAVAMSISQPAFAQNAPVAAPDAEQPCVADADNDGICDNVDDDNGTMIQVTGSRIRRDHFNTADPIQVITRDESTQAGFNSTAEVLQSVAVTGGTSQINNLYGGFVTNGGPGANTISLRGLGTSRTLVLLNGRRIAPSGARGAVGSADLNVLPNAFLERIEILNGGASSIYGSDAIAGVINLVTRRNVNGLELEAQHNILQVGAGNSYRYSAIFGFSNERFKVSGSLEYYQRNNLTIGDRDFGQCQTSYRRDANGGAPGTGDFIDPLTGQPKCYPTGVTGESGVTINTIATPSFSGATVDLAAGVPAGYTGTCNRFRPDPTAAGAVPGYECVGGGTLSLGIRDTFPRSLLQNSLISGERTYNGFLQASYQFDELGHAEVYGELLVNRRQSSQLQNRQFTIDYPFGSPLIPANLRFATAALPAQATNPGVPVGIRVFADYGNYDNRQTIDFAKATVGIRGNLIPDWQYDLYVSQAWSDAEYTSDLILTDRLNQSLDVVASGSGFACRSAVSGCVAAPSLTPAVVGGQFPQAWFDFVTAPVTGTTRIRETIVSGSANGPIFRLPGGEAQLAVGGEYRRNSINDTPSEDSVRGNLYNFSSSAITRGSDSVWEIFGEVELPLLRNVPFAEDLTITASGRYTDYASYGADETFKVGGIYSPLNWLSVRGSYGTSYRAPQLFEQFLGASSGFQSAAGDPCNNLGAAGQNPVRVANCQADGVPIGFTATNSIAVLQRGGADSGLGAETSKNWTVGVVVQPKLSSEWGTLSLSADYFNVLVNNGVSQLSSGTILSQCYDDPDFRAESICALVQRSATAPYALTVTTGYVNISNAAVSGWDINARYARRVGPGLFRLNAQLTKFDQRYSQNLPTDPIDNLIGTLNNPEWTGTFDASYQIKRVTFRYSLEWIQATYSSADFIGLSDAARATYVLEAPDYFLQTLSVRFETPRFGLTAGVRNLADVSPPQISSGVYSRITNSPLYSGYDYAGRTFYINANVKF